MQTYEAIEYQQIRCPGCERLYTVRRRLGRKWCSEVCRDRWRRRVSACRRRTQERKRWGQIAHED